MILAIPAFTNNDLNFGQNLLHWWEIILLPVYAFLFIKIGNFYYHKKFPHGTDAKLFINGLKVKLAGGIFITLIYNLYYLGGDTNAYFNDGRLLDKIFLYDPITAVRMFFSSGNKLLWSDDLINIAYYFRMSMANNTWIIAKLSGFFSFFCFQSMLCTSLFFAFFSYLCMWRFYDNISTIYPLLRKKLAIVIFVPSVIIWGSGIFKDTVTLSAMLVMFCSVYQVFFKRQHIVKNIVILFISGYILYIVKDYILFSFSVSMLLWLLISFSFSIKIKLIRFLLLLFILVFGVISSLLIMQVIGKEIADIALEDILKSAVSTGQYLLGESEKAEGSFYDLGKIEPTIQGFIAVAPKAINVTLFRPYLWESNKIIIFFSAIESTLIFIYFMYVLLKNKIIFFFTKILKDPYLILCTFFTLIFAVFVGVSSFNFGSLVRYKIPCLPFFLSALVIIDGKKKKNKVDTVPKE